MAEKGSFTNFIDSMKRYVDLYAKITRSVK